MLSRRNIRIKVLQQLYAFQQQDAKSIPVFQRSLERNFSDFYNFYYFNLQFLIDFNIYLESEKEIELVKYFPNKKHIRNTEVFQRLNFFTALSENQQFNELNGKSTFDWRKHGDLFNRFFIDLVQYDFFIDFNVLDAPDEKMQKAFLTNLYELLFNEFELFNHTMEDEYQSWDDDSADVLKALINSINHYYDKQKLKIESINDKQKEDIQFGLTLLELCIINKESLDTLIHGNTSNWDSERLTINDIIMLRMALCEFLYFETIPPKVSINEYLDIAKSYSTPKSHLFLNGVLDKIRINLTEKGKINKTGRGLKNE